MGKRISITAGPDQLQASPNQSAAAQGAFDALSISAAASTWGDEIYFRIPVSLELEDGQPPTNSPHRSS